MATKYVTPEGAGDKDGSSWANAFGTAELATNIASSGNGDIFYIFSGNYTLTGNVSCASSIISNYRQFIGISDQDNMTIATGTNKPVIIASTYTWDYNAYFYVRGIKHTCSNMAGIELANSTVIHDCEGIQLGEGSTRKVWSGADGSVAINSYASGAKGIARAFDFGGSGYISGCVVENSDYGAHALNVFHSIFNGITTQAIRAVNSNFCLYNTIYNCGVGIEITAGQNVHVIGNNFVDNDVAISQSNTDTDKFNNFSIFNNFSGNTIDISTDAGATANSSFKLPTNVKLDPQFIDADNGNFAIGPNLRSKGFPHKFPNLNTTSYVDIGAVQANLETVSCS